jgi:hypothetical protein
MGPAQRAGTLGSPLDQYKVMRAIVRAMLRGSLTYAAVRNASKAFGGALPVATIQPRIAGVASAPLR